MVLQSREVDVLLLDSRLEALKKEAEKRNSKTIRTLLKNIVPEYEPDPHY